MAHQGVSCLICRDQFLIKNPLFLSESGFCGVPETIRTPDRRIRSPLLYPTELLAHICRAVTRLSSIPDSNHTLLDAT